jgi:hypothetical protein
VTSINNTVDGSGYAGGIAAKALIELGKVKCGTEQVIEGVFGGGG